MKNSLEGIYIPAVTPFDDRERVSGEMLVYNIEKWNQTDVSGYMCLGSNGEFRMLDEEEHGFEGGLFIGADTALF